MRRGCAECGGCSGLRPGTDGGPDSTPNSTDDAQDGPSDWVPFQARVRRCSLFEQDRRSAIGITPPASRQRLAVYGVRTDPNGQSPSELGHRQGSAIRPSCTVGPRQGSVRTSLIPLISRYTVWVPGVRIRLRVAGSRRRTIGSRVRVRAEMNRRSIDCTSSSPVATRFLGRLG